MSDTKISALTAGAPAQSGDLIPIARAGANYSLTPANILNYGSSPIAGTSLTLNSGSALSSYISSSFTGTLTGCTTAPTGTVYYVKVGDQITLDVPTFTATSNATTKTVTGAPAAIFPASTKNATSSVSDNGGANAFALINITTAAVITYFKDASANVWTAAGTALMNRFCVTYTVN